MGMSVRSKVRQEDGAAAVEFALVVGLLAVLIFGLLEYGLAFWQVQNLRSATREGARVAAVRGDEDRIEAAMVDASAGSLSSGSFDFTVSPTLCDDDLHGEQITVELVNSSLSSAVQQSFEISIPFLPPITLDPTLDGSFRCE
jgi:Flp pilus assembly protein TadG